MSDANRDPFGRLLASPEQLTRRERIDCARRAAGALLAHPMHEVRWVGRALQDWLGADDGRALDDVLGVAPQVGQRRAQSMLRRAECAALLLRLSVLAGSDARAARMLRGVEPVPAAAAGLVLWQVALHQYTVQYGSDVLGEFRSIQEATQWLASRRG